MQCFRLRSPGTWVDVCLYSANGRWIATADTGSGRTLGTGETSLEALWGALHPFPDEIGDLLASLDQQSAG
jgi:hypothetical protein